MPSYTNCLRMGFHWEAQKSLQARWIWWPQMADQVFTDCSSLLVLPGSLSLGALSGGQETFLPSPNTFQLCHWERWPEFSFCQGRGCPQLMLSPILTHGHGHCITATPATTPCSDRALGWLGHTENPPQPPPTLGSSRQGWGGLALLLTVPRWLSPCPSTDDIDLL